jgi:putative DNA-invertase from lambdoid prophage Rac
MIYAPRGPDSNKLADYATRRGWDDVRAIQDFEAIMRAVRAGKVETLLASGLTGLGKSLQGLGNTVHELAERHVSLVIPSLGIVDGGSRQLLSRMIDAARESANVMVSESTKRGLLRARRRGVRLGRPKIAHRYREDVVKLRTRGLTGRAISQVLGLSSSSVFRLIAALDAAV